MVYRVGHPSKQLSFVLLAASPLLGVSLACCLAVIQTTRGLLENKTGQIAFASHRDGGWEIYLLNHNGLYTHYTRLTHNGTSECCPAWSRDGKQIALASWRDGNQEIYVMNASGSGLRRLTNSPAVDCDPA